MATVTTVAEVGLKALAGGLLAQEPDSGEARDHVLRQRTEEGHDDRERLEEP